MNQSSREENAETPLSVCVTAITSVLLDSLIDCVSLELNAFARELSYLTSQFNGLYSWLRGFLKLETWKFKG